MEKVYNNLIKVDKLIKQVPQTRTLKSNFDFMSTLVELSNGVLCLLKIVAILYPDEKSRKCGYTRRKAILVGLFVRMVKLYECLLDNICKKRGEITLILTRLIFETQVKMEYLMKSKSSSYKSFVGSSFRAEKETLLDLEAKKKQRTLLPIEKRMMKSVKKAMKEARISKKELLLMRRWKLDGKNFRALLRDIDQDESYLYMFRTPSHVVHGDWADLLRNHLKKEDRFYRANLEFDSPDPRLLAPITMKTLDFLTKYLRKLRLDRDRTISSLTDKLLKKFKEIDKAHEALLSRAFEGA